MAELFYSTQEILNQQFKTKMRGYDPEEVDEFLDNIIRDYEALQKEILDLQEENEQLNAQLDKLSKNPVAPRPVESATQRSTAVTNFDILKRLSNLEREVFGKKIEQQAPSASSQSVNAPAPSVEVETGFSEPAVDEQATRLF